jgi:hypothetical protein
VEPVDCVMAASRGFLTMDGGGADRPDETGSDSERVASARGWVAPAASRAPWGTFTKRVAWHTMAAGRPTRWQRSEDFVRP